MTISKEDVTTSVLSFNYHRSDFIIFIFLCLNNKKCIYVSACVYCLSLNSTGKTLAPTDLFLPIWYLHTHIGKIPLSLLQAKDSYP